MRTLEQIYPDPKARRAADAVTDAMTIDLPMSEFTARWNDAYVAAGGRIVLRRAP